MVYVNVVLFSFSKALGSSGIPFGSLSLSKVYDAVAVVGFDFFLQIGYKSI